MTESKPKSPDGISSIPRIHSGETVRFAFLWPNDRTRKPIMRLLIATFGIILLTGCVTQTPIVPSVTRIDIPPLNEAQTAELGDTILEKGKIYTYPGLDLKNEVHAGDGVFLKRATVPAGRLTAKAENKYATFYYADNIQLYDALIGTSLHMGGLWVSKTNASRVFIFWDQFFAGFIPKPKPEFELITIQAIHAQYFRQELIYNGRIGNSVKFLYRETRGQMARPAADQQIQYDLGEGKEIGFKSARIEIIEASNTKVTYRVLKSFPDLP